MFGVISSDEAIENVKTFLKTRINENDLRPENAGISITFDGYEMTRTIEWRDTSIPIQMVVSNIYTLIEFLKNTKPDDIEDSADSMKFKYIERKENYFNETRELSKIIEIDRKNNVVKMYAIMITKDTTVQSIF